MWFSKIARSVSNSLPSKLIKTLKIALKLTFGNKLVILVGKFDNFLFLETY